MNQAIEEKENVGPLANQLKELLSNVEIMHEDDYGQTHSGVETDFKELDNLISGLQAGQIIVVGSRPKMGDSEFVANIAVRSAMRWNRIVYVSFKNNVDEVTRQMVCATAQDLPLRGMVNNTVYQKEDFEVMAKALESLKDKKIHVIDTQEIEWTAMGIESAFCEIAGSNGAVDLLVIDGGQMLDVESFQTAQDREALLQEEFRQLKRMALVWGIPILVTVPLSSAIDARENKRPLLEDLKGMGMLEDIADTIMFLYRDEIYDEQTREPGVSEVIVAKQQHSSLGTVRIKFNPVTGKYDELN